MDSQLLILFVILLFAFILCTFLGGKGCVIENMESSMTYSSTSDSSMNNTETNYDNYNHYNGTSYPSVFYGPDGGTARIIETGDGNKLVITYKGGNTDIYYVTDNTTNTNVKINTYYGPNGSSAKIITTENGKQAVEVITPAGNKVLYYTDNVYDVDTFVGPAGGTATTITGPYDNTAVAYSSPSGNTFVGSTATPYDTTYYNSLPPGIPKSQIPAGDEDLYILKSQVVPPVCPRCPEPIVQCPDNFDATKCPPCPPCARCPEPAFECQKVPNYKSFNPDYMPIPVLSDFSAFGM
jgi:hypothetical protein